MTANEKILDLTIDRSIDDQFYAVNLVRRIISLLNRSDNRILEQIVALQGKIDPAKFNVKRLDALLKGVREINAKAYEDLTKMLEGDLAALVKTEASFAQKALVSVLPVAVADVVPNDVFAAAMSRPFQGKILREWIAEIETAKAESIRNVVRTGFIESQTLDQMVTRIRGTRQAEYRDGILEISRRNTQSVVLTALAHTANYAREAVYEANNNLVKGYRYTAVLDLRTTLICSSRDGQFYPMGKPRPAIPAHMRCRSVYSPVLKSFRDLGIALDDLDPGTRASLDGQVPETTTFQAWLQKQSVSRQNEVLGKTKASLFREGNLELKKFVAPSGYEYTIDQLRTREPEAFKRAGI